MPPPLLNLCSFPPSLPPLPLFAPSILELLWFRSLSFPSSILPAPAVLQPTTVSYWFIDCCLPVGERPQSPSLPPLSPAWICLSFSPSFFSLPRSPSLSLALSLPLSLSSPSPSPRRCSSSETWIRESRGVQFTRRNQIHLLPCARFFFLSLLLLFHLDLSLSSIFSGPFCVLLLSAHHVGYILLWCCYRWTLMSMLLRVLKPALCQFEALILCVWNFFSLLFLKKNISSSFAQDRWRHETSEQKLKTSRFSWIIDACILKRHYQQGLIVLIWFSRKLYFHFVFVI